jgi:hypothetical protein
VSQGKHRAARPKKKNTGLKRIVAGLTLTAAAVTTGILTNDLQATPQGDSTWGAPDTADDSTWGGTTDDSTWGNPPADSADADSGTTAAPQDSTRG